jgi:hypothetical protein
MSDLISADDLLRIVELSESIPEPYRRICFEQLLRHALVEGKPLRRMSPQESPPPTVSAPPLPIDVKAFLIQHKLEAGLLNRIFHIEDSAVRPLYQLQDTVKSRVQIQHALLMALETAISSGNFQFEVGDLRKRCQEQKCYDMANFTRHLKNNSPLFKSVNLKQPFVLSSEGKEKLADLLRQLARS